MSANADTLAARKRDKVRSRSSGSRSLADLTDAPTFGGAENGAQNDPILAAPAPPLDTDAGFTLDVDVLAERRAASARKINTVQIPAVRAGGFAILCVIAVLQDVRLGAPIDRPQLALLLVLNIGYAALSWAALRAWSDAR